MFSSYPTIKKFKLLLVSALLVFGSIQAQEGDYAANNPKNRATVAGNTVRTGMAVRIKARSDRQLMLNWTPFQGAVSHYVLERSGDGKNYEVACVFFTADGNEEPEYYYKDKLRKAYAGPLYYRLRIIGLDGTEVLTMPSISDSIR